MLSFGTTGLYNQKRESGGNPKKENEQNPETDSFEGYSRLSAIIKYYLQNFTYTKATYYALMEILLESASPKSINSNPVHLTNAEKSGTDAPKNRKGAEGQFQHLFKNALILPAIFELFSSSDNITLKQKVGLLLVLCRCVLTVLFVN